jgi:hypothetical protein
VSGAFGDYYDNPNPDVQCRKRQRIYGTVVQACSERQYTVHFDCGKVIECFSNTLPVENRATSLPPFDRPQPKKLRHREEQQVQPQLRSLRRMKRGFRMLQKKNIYQSILLMMMRAKVQDLMMVKHQMMLMVHQHQMMVKVLMVHHLRKSLHSVRLGLLLKPSPKISQLMQGERQQHSAELLLCRAKWLQLHLVEHNSWNGM